VGAALRARKADGRGRRQLSPGRAAREGRWRPGSAHSTTGSGAPQARQRRRAAARLTPSAMSDTTVSRERRRSCTRDMTCSKRRARGWKWSGVGTRNRWHAQGRQPAMWRSRNGRWTQARLSVSAVRTCAVRRGAARRPAAPRDRPPPRGSAPDRPIRSTSAAAGPDRPRPRPFQPLPRPSGLWNSIWAGAEGGLLRRNNLRVAYNSLECANRHHLAQKSSSATAFRLPCGSSGTRRL
jgi:hypothetical protein